MSSTDFSSKNKALLVNFLQDIWTDGDASKVVDYIAESYTIHSDPGDPWEGQTLTRDGFRDRLVTSRAAAPDQVFTPLRMFEEDNSVAVTWRWSGTHLGDLPGLPASGKPIRMTGATVYDITDNLLTGHWQIADRLGIYQQLTAQAAEAQA